MIHNQTMTIPNIPFPFAFQQNSTPEQYVVPNNPNFNSLNRNNNVSNTIKPDIKQLFPPFLTESINLAKSFFGANRRTQIDFSGPVTIIKNYEENSNISKDTLNSVNSKNSQLTEVPNQILWTKRLENLQPSLVFYNHFNNNNENNCQQSSHLNHAQTVKIDNAFTLPKIKTILPGYLNESQTLTDVAYHTSLNTQKFNPVLGQTHMSAEKEKILLNILSNNNNNLTTANDVSTNKILAFEECLSDPNAKNQLEELINMCLSVLDSNQPLIEPFEVTEDDIKAQESVVCDMRQKITLLLKHLESMNLAQSTNPSINNNINNPNNNFESNLNHHT